MVSVREAVWVIAPNLAVIFATVCAVTFLVVILNVAEVAPDGTTTVEGTEAELDALLRAMVTPDAPAAALRLTVPTAPDPPEMLVGEIVRLVSEMGFKVTVSLIEEVRKLAVIFAEVFAVTALVVMVTVAVVAPPATVMLEGTVALVELLANFTTRPPVGAADESVTEPVRLAPPSAVVGSMTNEPIVGGLIVRFAEDEALPVTAFITASVLADSGVVETLNVAEVLPAATVTVEPTDAAALDELRVTITPPDPAILLSVTVPVEGAPPAMLVGDRVTLLTV